MGAHEASLGAAPCAPKLSDWIRSYGERTVATLAPSLCHPRVCAHDSLFLVVGLKWNWCDMHAILHQAILFSVRILLCTAPVCSARYPRQGRAQACSTMMRTAEGGAALQSGRHSRWPPHPTALPTILSKAESCDLRSGRKS